jgi:uncharacterized protein (TIGR02996 family)
VAIVHDEEPWDRAALAVYADHLTAAGDPRGELIALELEVEDYGTTVEIDARRRVLLVEWIGGDRARLRRSYVRGEASSGTS